MEKYVRKSREERHREIYDAAVRVFLEKGYKNTTMEDIISATSLSKGGFYHYYNSTRDILIDIMRVGNYRFVESNIKIEAHASKEEVCKALTDALLDKILQETPEKKLYLMFAFEMVYDPDFEKIFLELENETFYIFDQIIQRIVPDHSDTDSKKKMLFISRMINALTFAQNLFSDKHVFKNSRETLYRIVYEMVSDLFV